GRIYKRVSLLGYISGVWLFFVIWLNLDNVYSLIGKEAYMSGKLVFVFIGLARLFDIISGLNTTILVTSKAFKYDLLFNLLLLIISILTNYYFIFILDEGVNGAAIATMISILLYNVSRVIFVYKLANIHPFTMGLLKVTVLAVGIWLGVSYMPDSSYPLLDIVWKSSLFTVFFGLTILGFRIAPDLNEFLEVILSRLTRWKSQIF
ncbi:MAG: polysaccharide biosynthesis C-terminal domain-containing protein, partial [Bacteroidota bacterium]